MLPQVGNTGLMDPRLAEAIERIYTNERDRILATLIGMVRDFDLAEETMHEAFAAALGLWQSSDEIPDNPRAWIVGVARHKALDQLRRQAAFAGKLPELQHGVERIGNRGMPQSAGTRGEDVFPDDRLRLIFTCCHPALSTEAQVALTLRTLCGISTDEIARAFLTTPQTMAQRLVRVKRKIAEAGIPYSVPAEHALPSRVDSVLTTIYLIFTSGYSAASGDSLVKADLCREAIRLARLVDTLLPGRGEPAALLSLMLFHDSRRNTRTDGDGNIVLLEDQDRSRWDREAIVEGVESLAKALRLGVGDNSADSRYAIEAQIASVHATVSCPGDTDWPRIRALYADLKRVAPSPVVELNEAVAIAMSEGAEAGLARLAELESCGRLDNYHLLPAAQARLLDGLRRWAEAAERYQRALTLARNEPERRFLAARLAAARARMAESATLEPTCDTH